MGHENRIVFDPFCLDLTGECLWRGSEPIKLRPKAFEVLTYLLGHPGQLVTKDELFKAVWPQTFVGEAVLKVTIRQLRAALDDGSAWDAGRSDFIVLSATDDGRRLLMGAANTSEPG